MQDDLYHAEVLEGGVVVEILNLLCNSFAPLKLCMDPCSAFNVSTSEFANGSSAAVPLEEDLLLPAPHHPCSVRTANHEQLAIQ